MRRISFFFVLLLLWSFENYQTRHDLQIHFKGFSINFEPLNKIHPTLQSTRLSLSFLFKLTFFEFNKFNSFQEILRLFSLLFFGFYFPFLLECRKAYWEDRKRRKRKRNYLGNCVLFVYRTKHNKVIRFFQNILDAIQTRLSFQNSHLIPSTNEGPKLSSLYESIFFSFFFHFLLVLSTINDGCQGYVMMKSF